jgi:hypothetical protein
MLLFVVAVELLFRNLPALLPKWYLESFPLQGVEILSPGITSRTPLEGVPLPVPVFTYQGPPPADIQDIGMVEPRDNPDPRKYPLVRYQVDTNGLLNASIPNSCNMLLIGDSFAAAAGASGLTLTSAGSKIDGGGLQQTLTKATGLCIYNLGVSGIGPTREKWLLEHVGLPLQAQYIVWFFFGGNDLDDEARLADHLAKGARTYADLLRDAKYPRWYGRDVLRKWRYRLKNEAVPRQRAALSGIRLQNSGELLWFYPAYLRNLRNSRTDWLAHPGWEISKRVLSDAAVAASRVGSKLLFVYIPSKEEIYLPYVEQDLGKLSAMAGFDGIQLNTSPRQFLTTALRNRHSLEQLFLDYCTQTGLKCVSANPYLDRIAAQGQLAYLAADTHWNEVGQNALIPVLKDYLSKN